MEDRSSISLGEEGASAAMKLFAWSVLFLNPDVLRTLARNLHVQQHELGKCLATSEFLLKKREEEEEVVGN